MINLLVMNSESVNFSLIKSNPEITAAEISDQLVISKRSVEKYLSKFKTQGILDRIGSDKSGRWLIIS